MPEIKKKEKPAFYQQGYKRKGRSRLDDSWKRPRGSDNKKRHKCKKAGKSPSIGYGQDKRIKGMHPTGKREVLVHNLKELEAIKEDVIVRISAKIGKKLKDQMLKIAEQKKLKVANKKVKKKPIAKKKEVKKKEPQKQKVAA